MKINFFAILLFAGFTHSLSAQNPIIPDIGMSDPHMRVFNDTLFLYCGHDSSQEDKTWIMKNWRVFYSTNLTNWELGTVISPADNYMGAGSTDAWAGDAASRNGQYYFYFSDRKRGIGVMKANQPIGHYQDALGKPLVAPMHDPTILIDDDPNKTPYMVYGDKEGSYHVVKLNDDMISLAEEPKPITITGEEWEKAPGWMDKNYIFKKDNRYYLSWGRDYAIADNIYGPYQSIGAVGYGHHLNQFAHGSFFNWQGQFYHIWCYYLKPGYKYRASIMSYCHFDKQGYIVTDTRFLDQHFNYGVGRYDAAWEKIEAEWYYGRSKGLEKSEIDDDNFAITNWSDNSWIHFAQTTFSGKKSTIQVHLQSNGPGKLFLKKGSANGSELAHIEIEDTAEKYQTFSSDLSIYPGKEDIYLVFQAKHQTTLAIDYFNFE